MHTYTHTYTMTSMYYFVELPVQVPNCEQGLADSPRGECMLSFTVDRASPGADTSQMQFAGIVGFLGSVSIQNLTIHARCDTVDSRLEAINERSWLGPEAIPSVLGRNGL